jgi:hypothetical protein
MRGLYHSRLRAADFQLLARLRSAASRRVRPDFRRRPVAMGLHYDLTDQTTRTKKRQGKYNLQKFLRHDFVLGRGIE